MANNDGPHSADEENGAGCWTLSAPTLIGLLALLLVLLARR